MMETVSRTGAAVESGRQYSLGKILGIWALAAVPMAILGWIVFPAVTPDFRIDPLGAGLTRFLLLLAGLVWLFVLSLIIVRQEEGNLRWAMVKHRLRLNPPLDPASGKPRRRLWLWIIPLVLGVVVWELGVGPLVSRLWVGLFPFLAEPPGYSMAGVFQSREILNRLVGAWWFLGLYVIFSVFNSILGEEFLFRGVLLPKMEGVFGKWSWVANGVLFGLYHVHQPWSILANALSGIIFLAWPSWRFRSTWMAVAVHAVENVYFAFLVLGVILGLA
jgi:uncharacterized protein